MNSFDDIFEDQPAPDGQTDQPFDRQAWGQRKQAERQAVYDMADRAAEAVGKDGGTFRAYLDVQARFDHYSTTNALLILAQMPQAAQLRDFNGWKESGVSIRRQQKGIAILEPGEQYTRGDGSVGTYYTVKRVFDISQTTAREQAQPDIRPDDRQLLKALISHPPVQFRTTDELPEHMGAYYDHDRQVIFVRRGMAPDDIFRSISMELAHAQIAAAGSEYRREDASFTAYSVSYLLCKKYGVDVSGFRFDQMPESFQNGNPQAVRTALSEIRDNAGEISRKMARTLEQNRPPKMKDQER